jgi:hypothetical protein
MDSPWFVLERVLDTVLSKFNWIWCKWLKRSAVRRLLYTNVEVVFPGYAPS